MKKLDPREKKQFELEFRLLNDINLEDDLLYVRDGKVYLGLEYIYTNKIILPHSLSAKIENFEIYNSEIKNYENLETYTSLQQIRLFDTDPKPVFDCIQHLPNLLDLEITFTCTRELQKRLFEFKSLRRLKLYLSQIIDDISNLQKLEELDLTGNPIYELPDALCELQNLTTINLEYTHISQLPDNIGNLKSLKKMILSYCNIASLPDSFSRLNLKYLEIVGCSLQNIPPQIYEVTSLKTLHVELQSPRVLSPKIGQLQNLNILSLIGISFTSFPDMSVLTNLTSLGISGTQYPDNIAKIGELDNLEILGLKVSGTGKIYETIPEFVFNLDNLKSLYLSSGRIRSIPDDIIKLDNLETLNLADNNLEKIPDIICKLAKLRKLDFSRNDISYVPECIDKLVQLENLSLRENKLIDLPMSLAQIKSPVTIDIEDNPFSIAGINDSPAWKVIIKIEKAIEEGTFQGKIYYNNTLNSFEVNA